MKRECSEDAVRIDGAFSLLLNSTIKINKFAKKLAIYIVRMYNRKKGNCCIPGNTVAFPDFTENWGCEALKKIRTAWGGWRKDKGVTS